MQTLPGSYQIFSPKSVRRLARFIGDRTITRAWVDNAADHALVRFATWDHVHGWYDRRTGEWDWGGRDDPHAPFCFDDGGELLLDLEPFEDDGRWPIHGGDQ